MNWVNRPIQLVALRQVAKAYSMTEVVRRAELGEEALFPALFDRQSHRRDHGKEIWLALRRKI